jgi:hypothetical protein
MRSPEDFPADIEAKALQLAYDIRDEVDFDGVTALITSALMERDRAATERAAKIAETYNPKETGRAVARSSIAAAIRSQP